MRKKKVSERNDNNKYVYIFLYKFKKKYCIFGNFVSLKVNSESRK